MSSNTGPQTRSGTKRSWQAVNSAEDDQLYTFLIHTFSSVTSVQEPYQAKIPAKLCGPNTSVRTVIDFIAEGLAKHYEIAEPSSSVLVYKPKYPFTIKMYSQLEKQGGTDINPVECQVVRLVEKFRRHWPVLAQSSDDLEAIHALFIAEPKIPDISSSNHAQFANVMTERYQTLTTFCAAPSSAAKSSIRCKLQASPDTRIHDGSYPHYQDGGIPLALPIEAYFPAFEVFKEDVRNPPNREFQPKFLSDVKNFMQTAMAIYTSENIFGKQLKKSLVALLERCILGLKHGSVRSAADGTMITIIKGLSIPLCVLEWKTAFGEGGCDPVAQAKYSALRMWGDDEIKLVRDQSNCPTLIIAAAGDRIAVTGVVWSNRFIAQPLADIYVGHSHSDLTESLRRMAHFITSIGELIGKIESFYQPFRDNRPLARTPLTDSSPRFYPYPREFFCRATQAVVRFTYIRPFDPLNAANTAFLVRTDEENSRQLVVKIVRRYGYQLHHDLATKHLAPSLHYCGLLDGLQTSDVQVNEKARGNLDLNMLYDGPTRMVVMDYVEDAYFPELPERAHELVAEKLSILHGMGMVLGDLRRPNVIFRSADSGSKYGQVVFIDFDWCGEVGKVVYPGDLTSGYFVEGVQEFCTIKQEHDIAMLKKHFSA